jgi:hypothetical protein
MSPSAGTIGSRQPTSPSKPNSGFSMSWVMPIWVPLISSLPLPPADWPPELNGK